jgi:NAD(P)H-hydrate epimerase
MRGGAGYVRASSPGVEVPDVPREAVGVPLPEEGWGAQVAEGAARFSAVVVGPGLGRRPGVRDELAALLGGTSVPVVLDADALVALGEEPLDHDGPLVLTPHDGEHRALMGSLPGTDRLAAARAAAVHHGAVVLLKGPTTVVAEPGGRALVSRSGDTRLATAGSGDVLSGLIGAHLAAGALPVEAAAAAAHLHGVAGRLAGEEGVVAGDVAEVLGDARAVLEG